MSDPTVRFAVGTSEKRYSSVWRLWTHGADAYLGARTSLGLFKLSMHKSGEWISAFTAQSGIVDEQTGSRRHKTWRRPSEFAPGWTQGPAICFPWVPWAGELARLEQVPPSTEWFPAPAEGCKLTVMVLFSSSSVSNDPKAVHAVCRPEDLVLDRCLPLTTGENVWLQGRMSPLTATDRSGLEDFQGQFSPGMLTASEGDQYDAWGMWITTSPELDLPLMVQMPLGRRHFRRV